MKIVTGYSGEPHITAEQDGSMNSGIVGTEDYVLPVGRQLDAAAITANKVRVYDGSFMMRGRHCIIEPNNYAEFTIENGIQGQCRNDILVAEYSKNTQTGIETVTAKTVKGTPGMTGTDPKTITGDIRGGANQHQMPLWRVRLDGLNIVGIERLFTVTSSLTQLSNNLSREYYASGLRIVNGSTVITPVANLSRHILFHKFSATYGDYATVAVTNGDVGGTGEVGGNSVVIIGTGHKIKEDVLYVYLDRSTAGLFRVNYTIFYKAQGGKA